eukprot:gb/GEZN01007103.1/.p1 GENE.gb/GEZN01007103.1/~~gb/GEZN01007103.1/.p1  ORF type:complete len:448 (+),score=111.81 gb/GEZN01007103.1/:27-1346(+)
MASKKAAGKGEKKQQAAEEQKKKEKEEAMAVEGEEEESDEEDEEDEAKDTEEVAKKQEPIMTMAGLQFQLTLPDEIFSKVKKNEATEQIMAQIKEYDMAPYYQYICKTMGWNEDSKLTSEMQEKNKTKLAELEKKREEAKETAGDAEVRDAMLEAAKYLANTGDKDAALAKYAETMEKTIGSGQRIDNVLATIRIGLMWNDAKLIKEQIEKAKHLVEVGGDWERRNVLGVYEAVFLVTARQWEKAVDLALKAMSTFTASELISYEELIFITVLLSVVCLDRVKLKKDVVNSPDILSVIRDIPNLSDFLMSLYNCKYDQFFSALAKISDQVKANMYFAPHVGFFLREVRIVAYTQFLESYRSVTFASMAQAFGVSVVFLDKELSRFIAAGRLNCKIDKVGGIVVTNRPDARNSQYSDMIKTGDHLLHRVQKLSQVLSHLK